jgi:hypothetical protein
LVSTQLSQIFRHESAGIFHVINNFPEYLTILTGDLMDNIATLLAFLHSLNLIVWELAL